MRFPRLTRLLLLSLAAALTAPLLVACTSQPNPDVSQEGSSGEPAEPIALKIGEKSYTVQAVNQTPSEAGVYLYDRTVGAYAEAPDGEFTDYVVVGDIVALAEEPGVPAILPEEGFAVRFFRTSPEETPAVGTAVTCSMEFQAVLPASYVRFGETAVEIGYHNTTRTGEATGFLFDGGWYSAYTWSNEYGTEVAVQDGKVVAVNRSGSETAGSTLIPEGGFVLSVMQGTSQERQLSKVQVGDDAELVERVPLYSVSKSVLAGVDRSRPSSGSVVYTSGASPEGEALTEITVGADGRISEIVIGSTGGTEVPEGGFVISNVGEIAAIIARRAAVGNLAVYKGSTLYLISTPDTYVDRVSAELPALRAAYEADAQALSHVDYRAADEALRALEEALSPAPDTATRVSRLESVAGLLETCRDAVIPCLTVQNRAAWVTVGEMFTDDSILLHYSDEIGVRRAVQYAKRMGLNTLIIDNAVGAYAAYPSQVEGMVQLPELNGFDVVQAFSDACREEGIRLIVMVCGLASVVSTHNYPKEHYINQLSDYILVSKAGKKIDASTTTSLDPSWPEARAFQCAVVKELAEKYDIDGIQIDYIRYPLPIYYQAPNYEDFGYQSPASEAFKAQYGVDPAALSIVDVRWADWCAYRRDVITTYARQLSETVKSVDESLEISYTCFADYNDRQIYVYQDVEKWAEEGFADAIYPMIYGDNTEYQSRYAAETQPVAKYTGYMLGVGTYVRASHASMIEQLYMPYAFSADGAAIFTLRYISTCGYNETVCRAFHLPATPAREGEDTVRACVSFLADRADALAYLYPNESKLSALAEALRSRSALPDAETLTALVEEHLPADEALRDALQADLAYVLRFMK